MMSKLLYVDRHVAVGRGKLLDGLALGAAELAISETRHVRGSVRGVFFGGEGKARGFKGIVSQKKPKSNQNPGSRESAAAPRPVLCHDRDVAPTPPPRRLSSNANRVPLMPATTATAY